MQDTLREEEFQREVDWRRMVDQEGRKDPPDPGPPVAARPKFSLKEGKYSAPQKLVLTDSTRNAKIYYTTNGWKPNIGSRPYTTPIAISHDERILAFAVAEGYADSPVTESNYTLPNGRPAPPPVVVADGVLHQGTRLTLAFTSQVNSKTAKSGDTVSLELASKLEVAGRTITNATAVGTVIDVEKAHGIGKPGEVEVRLLSIAADGVSVPVWGDVTAIGRDRYLPPSETAVIVPQTELVVTVDQDMRLP